MVTAICLPRLQPLAEDVSASGRPINFPPRAKNISLEPWKGFCQTRALIKWKGEFQKPFSKENSTTTTTTTTRPGFRRDIACKQALHSGVARSHGCYVHTLPVEFLPGRKFVRLGTPFTRNNANRTKIWTPRRSKIWTLKSRSNFWPVRSKIWTARTARCQHHARSTLKRK